MTDPYVMDSSDVATLNTLKNENRRQEAYQYVIDKLEAAKSNGQQVDEGTLAWAKAAKSINNELENNINSGWTAKYVEAYNILNGGFNNKPVTAPNLANASKNIANGFFDLIINTNGNIPTVSDTFSNDIKGMIKESMEAEGLGSRFEGPVIVKFDPRLIRNAEFVS